MRLDLSPLEKSLARLETSISYLRSDSAQADAGLRREFAQSVIQGFEYSYAVAVAMTDRALGEFARNPETLKELDFADRMREAADLGFIRNPRDFLEYRQKRNITSHAYNEDRAEEVLSVVDDFLADAKFLLQQLHKRNK